MWEQISHHLLLVSVVIPSFRLEAVDFVLFGINLMAGVFICVTVTPEKITPAKTYFKYFACAFLIQVIVLGIAYFKENTIWFFLWLWFLTGAIFHALEWPKSVYFGHHEILHFTTITGNFVGLIIDVTKM